MPNYAKNDMAASRSSREEMDRSGVAWFKATPNKPSFVRTLPPHVNMVDPTSGANRFYHPVCLHFNIGPSKKVVPCPRRMLDKFCAICDTAFALKNSGHEQAGNELLPSWQAYTNVIVYETKETKTKTGVTYSAGDVIRNKKGEVEVRVWSASRGVLDQIFDAVEERQAEAGGYVDIADPEAGFMLKINRKGDKKENTKYRVTLAANPSSIMDSVDEWDAQIVDLTQLSPMVEGLKELMQGEADDPFAGKAIVQAAGTEDDEAVDGEFEEVPWGEDDEPVGASAAQQLKDIIDGKKKANAS